MKSKKHLKKNKPFSPKRKPQYRYLSRKYLPHLIHILKGIIIFAILVVIVHFMFYSGHFTVSNVAIYGTDRFVNSADMLQIANQNLIGKNIFTLEVGEVQMKLKDNFLGAQEIELKRKFPKTIDVVVTERKPIAIVYQNPEEKYYVDVDGYVLGFTSPENENLPQINYKKDISVGLFIDKDLVPMYLELTNLLNSENISVSSMSFQDKYVNFSLEKGEDVFVGLEKNKTEVVEAISALLKEAELKSKTIKRIDLRYDKVIVLFN